MPVENGEVENVDVKPILPFPWMSQPSICINADSTAPNLQENDDSSGSFACDENSSYFQFFRGIYNDYQELPATKQRMFKRQCLNLLHNLLDEEESNNHILLSSPKHISNILNATTLGTISIPELQNNGVADDDDVIIGDSNDDLESNTILIKEEANENDNGGLVLPHD